MRIPYEEFAKLKARSKAKLRNFKRISLNVSWLLLNYCKLRLELKKEHRIENLKIYQFYNWHDGSHYFTGTQDSRKVFIKTDLRLGIVENEIVAYKILMEKLKGNLIPIAGFDNKNKKYIIHDFISGENLAQRLQSVQPKDIPEIFQRISHILTTMRESEIVHRDLRAENFILADDGSLYIIDFYFSTSPNLKLGFSELDTKKSKNIKILQYMGKASQISPFVWDDSFAMYNIAKKMSDDSLVKIDSIKTFESNIGKLQYHLGCTQSHDAGPQ